MAYYQLLRGDYWVILLACFDQLDVVSIQKKMGCITGNHGYSHEM
jgi:hypothetical protein